MELSMRGWRGNIFISIWGFSFCTDSIYFIVGLVPAQELPSGSYFLHMKEWILNKQIGFYKNETINTITSVWTSVLIIHFIWAMSYILFRKEA